MLWCSQSEDEWMIWKANVEAALCIYRFRHCDNPSIMNYLTSSSRRFFGARGAPRQVMWFETKAQHSSSAKAGLPS